MTDYPQTLREWKSMKYVERNDSFVTENDLEGIAEQERTRGQRWKKRNLSLMRRRI